MSKILSPCLRALLRRAFAEATSLVPLELQSRFILVGGAALERWGRTRRTPDVDIAASPEAMVAFLEGARLHPCFRVEADASVSYLAGVNADDMAGLCCKIDLLIIGDEAIPWLLRGVQMSGVCVASLPELMLLKALAYVNGREQEETDRADVVWVVQEMERRDIGYDLMQIVGLARRC